MNLIRKNRIKEEDEERESVDQIYKEKIIKAEQEKLAQLEITTKLKEEEEQGKIIQPEEKKEEEQEEIIQPVEEKKD